MWVQEVAKRGFRLFCCPQQGPWILSSNCSDKHFRQSNLHFQTFIVMAFPKKTAFLRDFLSPDLLFLAFLVFLAFFLFKEFLAILSVFPFFPKDFRGSAGRRNPCLFGGFPCCFPKRQGKEDEGLFRAKNHPHPRQQVDPPMGSSHVCVIEN